MIAREAALTFLTVLLLIVGGLWFADVLGWHPVLLLAIAIVALLFERRRYERRTGGQPGPEWELTGESWIDPNSGHIVRVWFDPETGERREVRSEPPLH